jgi:hypothetical protein
MYVVSEITHQFNTILIDNLLLLCSAACRKTQCDIRRPVDLMKRGPGRPLSSRPGELGEARVEEQQPEPPARGEQRIQGHEDGKLLVER